MKQMTPRAQNELTVAIVGVGLIGGSLGMAWRAANSARRVIGIVRRPEAVEEVIAVGACDEATTNMRQGVQDADVVVVCTPVTTIVPTVQQIAPYVKPGTIITDAGSTKHMICEKIWGNIPNDVTFIGGHPMAGSEKTGVRAADPYLFQNAVYVLTPPDESKQHEMATLQSLVKQTGAHTIVMDPKRHDLIVAAVSHVPHLLAATLVRTVSQVQEDIPETLNLAAGGFRDTTRIAEGSPGLWRDIVLTNRDAIQHVLHALQSSTQTLQKTLEHDDGPSLESYLSQARDVRMQIPNRAKGILTSVHELVVQVVDRPGEIAAVTRCIAEAGLNLIDIEIMRVREGEGGTLRIGFEDEVTCEQALHALQQHGYAVRVR